jgi:hypothetical protein
MQDASTLLVMAHLVSTLLMVGMIWTVQLVHYPLMALVGADRFVAYAASHAPRMAATVMLPWAVQGGTTVGLLIATPPGVARSLVWAAAVAAAVPVAVTVLASVPAHARLATGFDAAVHHRLVTTNWLRTAGWSIHGAIAIAIAVTAG